MFTPPDLLLRGKETFVLRRRATKAQRLKPGRKHTKHTKLEKEIYYCQYK